MLPSKNTIPFRPLPSPLEEGIAQLKKGEYLFGALAEKLGDILWYMDLDLRTRYISPTIYSNLGFTPAEWMARPLQTHMTPASFNHALETFQKEMEREQTAPTDPDRAVQLETEYLHRNGSSRWFQNTVAGIRDKTGRLVGLHGISRDITKQKRAEQESARKSMERRLLLDTIPIQIWYLTDPETYGAVNKAHADFLGVDPKDLAYGPIEDFRPPEIAQMCKAGNREVFQTGMPIHTKEWMKDSRGEPRLIAVAKTPRLNEHGKVQYVVCAGTDITEETRRHEMALRLNQIEKTDSLGRMAGAIAHHFNNQLSVVMGNLELAMDQMPPGAVYQDNLVEAQQAARRGADLSSRMLTYLGQTPVKKKPLELCETCRSILPMLQVALPLHVQLETDFTSSGPVIRANTNQVQQVLTSLLTNAWEAMGDTPGTIFLTIKTMPSMEIPSTRRFPMDWEPAFSAYACLEIRDTGRGMTLDTIDRVFDPFYTDKFTGRGLGLPVVLGLVKASDGAVSVESAPDEGSIFRVFWPLSMKEPVGPSKTLKNIREIEGGGTILLIDDEDMLRKMGHHMLEHLGFAVLTAPGGEEALDIFREHLNDIRCVITDLGMPGLNGWETLASLRKIDSDLPVILASGYDEASVMAEDHAERPQAFLSKPYSLKDLKTALGQALLKTIS